MTRDDYDPSCFGCGVPRTINGHLCWDCYRERVGTIHFHWNDDWYISAMQDAAERIEKRTAQQAASRRRAAERKEAA